MAGPELRLKAGVLLGRQRGKFMSGDCGILPEKLLLGDDGTYSTGIGVLLGSLSSEYFLWCHCKLESFAIMVSCASDACCVGFCAPSLIVLVEASTGSTTTLFAL
jgi:hypothetical protein